MATRRAAAKAEAAEMVDIAARLAPFFPPPVGHVIEQDGGAPDMVAWPSPRHGLT